ncbi:MAG: hypothetical protein LBI61_04185 [Puniceicoccales bacterium]|nr:hypothetical protein [Puniceicoccales bacterium]
MAQQKPINESANPQNNTESTVNSTLKGIKINPGSFLKATKNDPEKLKKIIAETTKNVELAIESIGTDITPEKYAEFMRHTVSKWEYQNEKKAWKQNDQTHKNLETIDAWDVNFLEERGVFNENSNVDIFDRQIFNTLTAADVKREGENLTLTIDGCIYRANGANRSGILQAIKNLAKSKYPNDDAKQRKFVLHCIQGLHKWGGQGSAFGTASFLTKPLAEKSAFPSYEKRTTNIVVDSNKIIFDASSGGPFKSSGSKVSNSNLPFFCEEHSKFEVDIEGPDGEALPAGTLPHFAPDTLDENYIKIFKTNEKQQSADGKLLFQVKMGPEALLKVHENPNEFFTMTDKRLAELRKAKIAVKETMRMPPTMNLQQLEDSIMIALKSYFIEQYEKILDSGTSQPEILKQCHEQIKKHEKANQSLERKPENMQPNLRLKNIEKQIKNLEGFTKLKKSLQAKNTGKN